MTKDNLLVATFGGFFLGAGIGLSVRGGAVIDGNKPNAENRKKLIPTLLL